MKYDLYNRGLGPKVSVNHTIPICQLIDELRQSQSLDSIHLAFWTLNQEKILVNGSSTASLWLFNQWAKNENLFEIVKLAVKGSLPGADLHYFIEFCKLFSAEIDTGWYYAIGVLIPDNQSDKFFVPALNIKEENGYIERNLVLEPVLPTNLLFESCHLVLYDQLTPILH